MTRKEPPGVLSDVYVFAMQPHLRVADLGTPGGLAGRLRGLMRPVAARPDGAAALVVFPAHVLDGPTAVAVRGPGGAPSVASARPIGAGRGDAMAHAVVSAAAG